MKPFWRTYFSNGWFNQPPASSKRAADFWWIFGSLKQGETCWKHVANINISNTLVKYSMWCSNYDDNLRMIIVENNYASPPVLTKTTFRDDISCLYFQTSKRGGLREVICQNSQKLSEKNLEISYLNIWKNTKHIPKRQQQTANTRNFQFLSTKKQGETPSTLDSPFWLVEIFKTDIFWPLGETPRNHGNFQLRSRSLELSNNPPVGWWKDVEVVIRFPPPP